MVQVLLRPWSLFIESLGSYSRCRVSNGVMPCVLGPTSFNLKFWANILISDEHQNVVVFMMMIFIWVHDDLHLGSSLWMNTWISACVICFSYEFLGNNQSMGFSTYIRKLLSQICLGTGAGKIKWILHLHAYALRDCWSMYCTNSHALSISDWAGQICFCFCLFAFHLLYCS